MLGLQTPNSLKKPWIISIDASLFYYIQIKKNNCKTLRFENHVSQNLLEIIL